MTEQRWQSERFAGRVLLVDGDPRARARIEAVLAERWPVLSVSTIAEARDALGRGGVAALITSATLPDGRGVDLLSWCYEHVPTVARIVRGSGVALLADAINRGRVFHALKEPLVDAALIDAVGRAIERYQLESGARSSQERYRELFELAQVGLLCATPSGRLLEVNQALARDLGREGVEALIGHELAMLVVDTTQWERALDVLGSGAALSDFELALRHSGGEPVYFLVNAELRRLGTGEHVLEASLLNYTNRRQHEQERRELHEHLFRVQRTETVGALAGGIAHDFNNLLTIILNCASTLGERVAHRPELAGSVGSIRDAATRAASLTTQLLNFARGGGSRSAKLKINDSVRDVVGLLSETVRRGIAIELELGEELPALVGNSDELHQCILNLSLNACEAMGAQGRLTIATRRGRWPRTGASSHAAAKPGDYIEVVVGDTGPGMSPEVQARIFEPFFTTKRRSSGGAGLGLGLGLGLAMVQRIVERHDGSIALQSAVGEGTSVSLLFPIPAARRGPPRAPKPKPKPARPGPSSSLIILADDEPAIRRVGKRILERERYKVITAENGEEAVARVQEHPEVLLVILDLVMPVMSGEEAYAKIREFNEDARFLLCTGHAVTRSLHNILRDARVRLLHKPYSIAEFTEAVRGVLEDSGGRRR